MTSVVLQSFFAGIVLGITVSASFGFMLGRADGEKRVAVECCSARGGKLVEGKCSKVEPLP